MPAKPVMQIFTLSSRFFCEPKFWSGPGLSLALCAGLFVSMQVGKLGPAIPVLRDDLGLSLVGARLVDFYAARDFSGGSAGRIGAPQYHCFGDHIRNDWHPWVHGDHAAVDVFGPARA